MNDGFRVLIQLRMQARGLNLVFNRETRLPFPPYPKLQLALPNRGRATVVDVLWDVDLHAFRISTDAVDLDGPYTTDTGIVVRMVEQLCREGWDIEPQSAQRLARFQEHG